VSSSTIRLFLTWTSRALREKSLTACSVTALPIRSMRLSTRTWPSGKFQGHDALLHSADQRRWTGDLANYAAGTPQSAEGTFTFPLSTWTTAFRARLADDDRRRRPAKQDATTPRAALASPWSTATADQCGAPGPLHPRLLGKMTVSFQAADVAVDGGLSNTVLLSTPWLAWLRRHPQRHRRPRRSSPTSYAARPPAAGLAAMPWSWTRYVAPAWPGDASAAAQARAGARIVPTAHRYDRTRRACIACFSLTYVSPDFIPPVTSCGHELHVLLPSRDSTPYSLVIVPLLQEPGRAGPRSLIVAQAAVGSLAMATANAHHRLLPTSLAEHDQSHRAADDGARLPPFLLPLPPPPPPTPAVPADVEARTSALAIHTLSSAASAPQPSVIVDPSIIPPLHVLRFVYWTRPGSVSTIPPAGPTRPTPGSMTPTSSSVSLRSARAQKATFPGCFWPSSTLAPASLALSPLDVDIVQPFVVRHRYKGQRRSSCDPADFVGVLQHAEECRLEHCA